MSYFIPLSNYGQIKQGSRVSLSWKGRKRSYKVREILNEGTEFEEVIINRSKNKYFIVSMALNGTSWAKNVEVKCDD